MAINNIPRSFQQWPATVPTAYAPSPVNAAPPDFNLDAGLYGLTIQAGVFGTATLRQLQPDGVTYIAVSAALAAPGYTTYFLPAGQYQMTLAGVTGFIGNIALVSRPGIR